LTEGWAISGITRFATGLPVTLASNGENFLVYAQNNGINSVSIDLPNVALRELKVRIRLHASCPVLTIQG
jgi:hypothetical protein